MLRPARSLPPFFRRLLTPRSGRRDLSLRLGPATRRSGAYRDGTCTRWIRAAWLEVAEQAQLPLTVRTHHEASVAGDA